MIGPSDSNACVDSYTDDASRSPKKFGATYIWGDSMKERPHNTHVRFYFQNCRIQATDAARVTMYKDMLSLNADVIGLAETHLNSRHTPTRNAIDDDFRRLWHSHKTTYSASNEHLATRSINGGTLQTTTGKLASRITAQGANDMGRFCWQRFHTSDTQQMTIITAYRVCQHSPEDAGETSAYMQQWRALQTIGNEHPNPRAAFLVQDLALFIDTKQREGDEILLQLDANTVSENDEWSIFLAARQLVDLHCIVSSDPFSQSFASGSTKTDYMLGTPKIAAAVRAGGILNFEQGLTSDHRGMYLDLDETSLFSTKNADPTRPLARQLRLSNVQATKKYLNVYTRTIGTT
jgi:exonuclease III